MLQLDMYSIPIFNKPLGLPILVVDPSISKLWWLWPYIVNSTTADRGRWSPLRGPRVSRDIEGGIYTGDTARAHDRIVMRLLDVNTWALTIPKGRHDLRRHENVTCHVRRGKNTIVNKGWNELRRKLNNSWTKLRQRKYSLIRSKIIVLIV